VAEKAAKGKQGKQAKEFDSYAVAFTVGFPGAARRGMRCFVCGRAIPDTEVCLIAPVLGIACREHDGKQEWVDAIRKRLGAPGGGAEPPGDG
jgi:hypothetical protein